jgi:hypothetical protein
MEAMTQARQAYIEEMMSEQPEAVEEFNEICPSHDDYIWFVNVASSAPEDLAHDRPAAGLTSYMVCDSSWSWLEHFIGGKYRRALVLDAADCDAILDYWSTLWDSIEAEQPELLRTFSAICHSHTDYVWDLSLNQ